MVELKRQLAAVMFADMVGYTALIARDEKAALAARTRHRKAIERVVRQHGGRLLQYFGDGSLSIFPSAVESVRAAIEAQREFQTSPKLPVRIGLHISEINFDEQGAYGNAVNGASRIEKLSPPGGILVSRKIVEELANHPDLPTVRLGTFELKNIPEPMDLYAIFAEGIEVPGPTEFAGRLREPGSTAELPSAVQAHLDRMQQRSVYRPRDRGVLPIPFPIVGREAEMEFLGTLLKNAEAGQGGAAIICGDRGVGKSRLAEAVAEDARRNGWLVSLGRAYPAERVVSFAPFSDAFLPILRGLEPSGLAALGGDKDAIHSLFPSLGPPSTDISLRYADPNELQLRLFSVFATFLSRLSEHQPLLIILEDLQWADESSIELLHFVARHAAHNALFLIYQYSDPQPDRQRLLRAVDQSLLRINVATLFELEPLTPRQTEELIRRTFDSEDPAISHFSVRLCHWTGGNPLFLGGTLQALIAAQHLVADKGGWRGWGTEQIELLPRSVREDVLVRAAQLSGTARELAELAAVIGTRTSYEMLDQVGGLARGQLEEALEELQRHQILVEDEVDQMVVYDFNHPLIRETLKSELSLARRRTLHGHVAESLEQLYADAAGAHAAELAHHFMRAHRGTAGVQAVRYLALAGKDALSRHANHEAARHLREALDRIDVITGGAGREYIDQNVNVRDVVTGLAKAETRLGNYEESIKLWRRELEAASAVDDQHRVARVHRELGLTLFWGARLEEAQEEFQEGVQAARTSGDDLTIAYINLASSLCYQQTGQIQEARRAIEEALELAEKHNNVPLLARVHTSLARLHLWQGEHDLVRPNSEKAIELATECDDPGVVFWGHWGIGVMEGMRGNLTELSRRIRKMNRIVEALNSPILKLWTTELSIEHAYCYGDWDAGIELGESAVALARSLHQNTLLPRLLVWLSIIYIGRGDFERVKELTDEAWEVSGAGRSNEKFVDVHTVVPAHIGRSAYHLAMGEWEEAIRFGERGLAIANRSGYGMWSIHRLLPMVGEAQLHSRNLERAKEIEARIRHLSEPLGHRLGLAWADGLKAILVWLEGDTKRGADLLRQASDALDAIPMRLDAARLRRQLAGRLADLDDREGALRELRAVHATFAWLGCARELENTRGQFGELGAEPPPLG